MTDPETPIPDAGVPLDFEALFTAAPTACLILDLALNIVAANDAFLAMTGTRRPDLIGQLLFDAFPSNPAYQDADAIRSSTAFFRRVIDLKRPEAKPLQRRDVPLDGGGFEERYWRAVSVPVFGADGEVRWIFHSVQDVTELARLRRVVVRNRAQNREQTGILGELRSINHVLGDLDDRRFDLLAEHLTPVVLPAQAMLYEPGAPQEAIYFLFGGLVSINRAMADGTTPSVAFAISTGLIGVSVLLGSKPLEEAKVLIPGPALRLDAEVLRTLTAENPGLRRALGRDAVPLLLAQITSIAACANLHRLDQRLARWLLTAAASTGSAVLPIGQEAIAACLGVRRTGISEALSRLGAAHLVSVGRNQITLTNRAKLERRACHCRAEFEAHAAEICRGAPLGPTPDPAHIAALFKAFAAARA